MKLKEQMQFEKRTEDGQKKEDNNQPINSLGVNCSGASLKKTGVPVLLNALDSRRFYVGSYAPSRLSKQVKITFDHGRLYGPPPSSARTSLASGGPWEPPVLRVL